MAQNVAPPPLFLSRMTPCEGSCLTSTSSDGCSGAFVASRYFLRESRRHVVLEMIRAAIATIVVLMLGACTTPDASAPLQPDEDLGVLSTVRVDSVSLGTLHSSVRLRAIELLEDGSLAVLLRPPASVAFVAANHSTISGFRPIGAQSDTAAFAVSLAGLVGASVAVNFFPGVEAQVHEPNRVVPTWVGLIDSGATAIARWRDGLVAAQATSNGIRVRFSAGATGVVVDGIQRQAYERVPRARTLFGLMLLTSDDSSVYLISSIADSLYRLSPISDATPAIGVPVTRRWGTPPSPEYAIREADSLGHWGRYSRLEDLAIVDSTRVAVIFQDIETVGEARNGRAYLTILDRQTGVACVDIPIPGKTAPLRSFSVRGDTLVVAAHLHTTRQLVLERFSIHPSACQWTP